MGPPAPRATLSLAAAVLLLAGCAPDARRDPFTATGELVAMSGGDAGPDGACFTCHGLRGQGDEDSVPRLAGLPAGYLQKQLEDYAAERRPDPVMVPIARALHAADRRTAAAYYAGLPSSWTATNATAATAAGRAAAARLYHQGDPRRGLAPCASCHGATGEGGGAANPPLAGQPPAYLAEQLRRWKTARRRNDPRGEMLALSRRLTDAEIAALSTYAAGLSGPTAPAGPPRAASPPERRADAAHDAAPSPRHAAAAGSGGG